MTNENQLQQAQQQVQQQPQNRTLADRVYGRVAEYQAAGQLQFPADYSPENALKSAWLILQNTKTMSNAPVLQACDQTSVANTLFEMVVQGLDPVKKQCYFIAYGNQLTLQRSYFGTMAVTKRAANAKSIDAQVIYEGDNVTYEMVDGRITNLKHAAAFGNINKDKIVGAYCIIKFNDGSEHIEIMTIEEIRQAWAQSKMKKNQNNEGQTHEKFRQEMSKKTVINRACKKFLNSSTNSDLFTKYAKQSDDRLQEAQVLHEVQTNANQIPLDFEPVDEEPVAEAPNVTEDGEIIEATESVETVEAELVMEPAHPPHVEQPDMYEKAQAETQFTEPTNNAEPF